MRIVIAAGIFPPDIGGPATYAAALADYLSARGHTVAVICYGTERQDAVDTPYTVHRVPRGMVLITYGKYLVALWKLALRADCIYAQGPVAGGIQSFLVSRLLARPYAVKVTGDYAWEQAVVRYKSTVSIDAFQRTSQGIPLSIRVIRLLQRWVVRHADQVVVPSTYLRTMVLGWCAPEKNVAVIFNAVSSVPMAHANEGSRRGINEPLVLSVGRLVPWKGFSELIKLWPRVLSRLQAKLIIVGDGPQRSQLETIIEKMHLQSSCLLVGRKAADELANYYPAADLFVLNSGYEGFAHTILEAQAHGVVVAASLAGGNPEIVEHGVSGLLFSYNAADEIVDCITDLLQHRDKAGRLAAAALRNLKRFDPKLVFGQTMELLQRCAAKRG